MTFPNPISAAAAALSRSAAGSAFGARGGKDAQATLAVAAIASRMPFSRVKLIVDRLKFYADRIEHSLASDIALH